MSESAWARLTRTRWFRAASIIGALGVLVTAELIAADAGAPFATFILPDTIGGLMFIVAGAVAWARRPDNITGPLLVLTSVLWFIGSNAGSPNGAVASISYSFIGYRDLSLAFLALVFPTGRLHPRAGRIAVGLMAGTMLVRSLGRLLLAEPSVYYACSDCPANPFRVALDQSLYEGVDRWGTGLLAVLSLAVMVLVLRRWAAASGPARRVMAPVLVAGGVAMAVAAFHHTAEAVGLAFGIDLFPASETLRHLVVWGLFFARALVPLGFLLGVLRLRSGRAVVADLVLDLTDAPPRERLRESLAQALSDPTLTVAYWSPELGRYTNDDGRSVEVNEHDETRAVTVLERQGEPLAMIAHDPALLEDPGLVRSVGAAVRMAVENERLREELEARLHEVEASRARIVAATDEERRRVERDLHDGAQQRLLTLSMALKMARAQAGSTDEPELQRTLAQADAELKRALVEIRELARGIHPAVLSRSGLAAALRSLAERSPVPVDIAEAPTDRFPASVEATVYFVVSEALANVGKHAGASRVTISVTPSNGALHIEVRDDGAGGADPQRGSGLLGLRDRVAALGGRFEVESPPGEGTVVRAEVPCQ
jgi:signal transduction histidine kinase